MSYNPLVTIYIPTKNRLQLLEKAIASVLQQTYTNWELIIVDDASTDGTKDYLDKLTFLNPKIKAIYHIESQGACASRNDAIFSAKGDFITGLDDDDYFAEERLAYFLEEWDKDDVIALSTNNISVKDGLVQTKILTDVTYYSQKDLLYYNYLNNQVFTKTEYLKEIGGFNKDLKVWQDYECWYRLLSKGRAKKLSNPTYYFDISDRSDRISLQRKSMVIDSCHIFATSNNLSKTEKRILEIPMLYYGHGKLNLRFMIDMLWISKVHPNYIKFLKKEVISPLFSKFKLRNND